MRYLLQLLTVTLGFACGPAPGDPEPSTDSPSASQGDPSTTNLLPTSGATSDGSTDSSTSSSTSTSSTSSSSSSFLAWPDLGGADLPCNPWAQDCPEGQKCAPWIPSGQRAFTDTRCVEIIGDQAPGETCTAPEGPFAGIDDCAQGSFCWDVDDDKHGICFPQCAGNPEEAICPLKTYCSSDQYSVLALCFPDCDPILQDCGKGELCLQIVDGFVCVPDASGDEGQANDPCEFPNGCDPGLVCIAPVAASSNCNPRPWGCCQPFCALPDGSCPNPDQQCIPLELTPAGYEDLGICAVPN